MNLKKGTPGFGLFLGLAFALIGILLMTLGFWKCLLLVALFAVGYFLGSVENKEEVLRETANRLIPRKETTVIDFKSEVEREQTVRVQEALKNPPAQTSPAADMPAAEAPASGTQPAGQTQTSEAETLQEE